MCQDEPGYLMCVHDRIKSIQCHRLLLPHVFSSKLKARILNFPTLRDFTFVPKICKQMHCVVSYLKRSKLCLRII